MDEEIKIENTVLVKNFYKRLKTDLRFIGLYVVLEKLPHKAMLSKFMMRK